MMIPPICRIAALAWLSCIEMLLSPLRALAAPPGMTEAEQRALQEEAWAEIAAGRRGAPIREPIFTEEVVGRAKGH